MAFLLSKYMQAKPTSGHNSIPHAAQLEQNIIAKIENCENRNNAVFWSSWYKRDNNDCK